MRGSRDAGKTYLDMLLEILGPLEGLATELALVRLERDMDADVRGDVIALDSGGPTLVPLASQHEVVRALATHMFLAEMVLLEVVRSGLAESWKRV